MWLFLLKYFLYICVTKYNKMRVYHEKYGYGSIIDDAKSLCLPHECLFKPDGGIVDKTSGSGTKYTHFVPASFDIVDKTELKTF